MTLTPKEIRSMVSLYMKLKLDGCDAVMTVALSLRAHIENVCEDWIHRSKTMRWAATHVGPVLAAGLGVGINLKSVQSAISFWRVAGLANPHNYSPADAVKLLNQCGIVHGGSAEPEQLALVEKFSGRHLTTLTEDATFADIVYWLSRRTYSTFLRSVVLECADMLAVSGGEYGMKYTQRMSDLEQKNESHLLSWHAESSMKLLWTFNLNDIRDLLEGKAPRSSLMAMAKHDLSRMFLEDYYNRATQNAKVAVST
jgi:hypothetical protein